MTNLWGLGPDRKEFCLRESKSSIQKIHGVQTVGWGVELKQLNPAQLIAKGYLPWFLSSSKLTSQPEIDLIRLSQPL
jgi:hypothetical protein